MEFEKVYRTYWQRVYRLCLAYLNDSEPAKDLAQETFIIVWEKLGEFRGESDIGTWIYRIATNNCLKYVKREKNRRKLSLPEQVQEFEVEDKEPEIKKLCRYISELPELDRIIITLELDGVNQQEIASIVGLQPGNVRVRVYRIKEKLTNQFKQNE